MKKGCERACTVAAVRLTTVSGARPSPGHSASSPTTGRSYVPPLNRADSVEKQKRTPDSVSGSWRVSTPRTSTDSVPSRESAPARTSISPAGYAVSLSSAAMATSSPSGALRKMGNWGDGKLMGSLGMGMLGEGNALGP